MANQTKQLAGLLSSEGVKVTLVQTNRPYPHPLFARIKGIRAVFRLIPYILELWTVCKNVDCLHVMANSGWSWQVFAAPAIWVAWFKNVPVIVNYRGGEAEVYLQTSIKFVAPTLKKISALVVPSGFLQTVFDKYGFAARVIPNIVDLNRFAFASNKCVRNKEAPVIVIARNLESIYGIDVAIEAIAILRQKIPLVKVLIAGSGPLLESLSKLVQQKALTDNIEFTGKLTPEQIAGLYAKADIMLNPTRVDNMPNSLLEALAAGLPIVTTAVGGIPYIVSDGETALMVEPNNPEMMAAKLEQLIIDGALYEKLAENGIQYVQQYAWRQVKQQWLTLYEQVTA
ncbi:glycosyltransferase family 4 protein [Methylomonas sp. SURF-2]|uniref:Glycosyltransferase family 4 protein n=1 Tax=Methylomonas subterranea TaxID=2952225 RepID=A0ABT1TB17_9GAMM|nr:glycosyltransferase family 4 protein [Methylomonas sp. SURF-2]MCQ8102638.1 glycosyltransferase family 4 protein [Methylomonas sp. SURF-2]